MSNLDKDKVIAEYTEAYQKAHGKKPKIESSNGWYSVDGGKNVRLSQLADDAKALGKEKKSAPKKSEPKKTEPKKAEAKKPAAKKKLRLRSQQLKNLLRRNLRLSNLQRKNPALAA